MHDFVLSVIDGEVEATASGDESVVRNFKEHIPPKSVKQTTDDPPDDQVIGFPKEQGLISDITEKESMRSEQFLNQNVPTTLITNDLIIKAPLKTPVSALQKDEYSTTRKLNHKTPKNSDSPVVLSKPSQAKHQKKGSVIEISYPTREEMIQSLKTHPFYLTNTVPPPKSSLNSIREVKKKDVSNSTTEVSHKLVNEVVKKPSNHSVSIEKSQPLKEIRKKASFTAQNTPKQFRIPSIKRFYPLLSSLVIDLTALELYEYVKVKYDPLKLLKALKVFMEMDSSQLNLGVIKILTFQIILNIGPGFNEIYFEQLIVCMFNIHKYQTHHHKNPIRIINFKNGCCFKIMKKLFGNNKQGFIKLLLTTICEYLKVFIIILDISDQFLIEKYPKKAFAHIYVSEKIKYPVGEKIGTIRLLMKEYKFSIDSLKLFIKTLFQAIKMFKISEFDVVNSLEIFKSLQIFIESSLIIINDIHLLKYFKNLKLQWVHKAWEK